MNIKMFNVFKREKKYKLVSSIGYDKKELRSIYKYWDKSLNIPYELGIYLEDLVNNQDDGNYYIGVHSSSAITSFNASNDDEIMNNEVINDIFNNGLINNGDLSSGASNNGKYNDINKTVASVKDIFHLALEIRSEYKGSRGGFILKFPKEYVTDDLDIKSEMGSMLYDIRNGIQYIKPEFILGYVGLGENDKFVWYPREMFLEKEKNK